MKLLKPENGDYLEPLNGNPLDIPERICELLKLNNFPIIIQFNDKEDVVLFADAVFKCNKQ